jgi:competence protein ComEC
VPRAGWIALGAVLAAVLAVDGTALLAGDEPGVLLPGPAASLAMALALALGAAAAWRRSLPGAAATAGASVVALRLVAGALQPALPPATLPTSLDDGAAEVLSISTPSGGAQRAVIRLEGADAGTTAIRLYASLPRYPEIVPGDRLAVSGSVRPPPDGTGFGDYLRRSGIAGTITSRTLERVPATEGPAAWLERRRRDAGEILARILPAPQAGLAAGILIGLRDQVDRDVATAFTAAGLTHIVAISGWNIAVVGGVLATLLRRTTRRRRSVATLAAIAAYALAAGAGASVVRAAVMASAVVGSRELGRPGTAAAALGLAVVAMLLVDPTVIGDAGFQLSVAATAGLLAWGTPLTEWLRARLAAPGTRVRAPAWLIDSLGVSLAAQASTLPLVLLDFGRVSLVSPLANLVAAPLVVPVMAASAAALVAGWPTTFGLVGLPGSVLDLVALLVGSGGAVVLGPLVGVGRAAASVPGASVTLAPPATQALAAVVALVVGVVASPGARRRAVSTVAALGHGVRPASRDASPQWPGSTARRQIPGTSSQASGRPPAGRSLGTVGQTPGRLAPGPSPQPRLVAPVAPGAPGHASPRRTDSRVPLATRSGRLAVLLTAVAVAALVLVAAARPDGRLHVAVLDVGQGDAILVLGPSGGRILVDAGPDPDRLLTLLDARVPAWDRRIDLLVLTHPHEDHVAGAALLVRRYRVAKVAEPGMRGSGPGWSALVTALAAAGRSTERLAAGDRIDIDGATIAVLWPRRGTVPEAPAATGAGVNDVSIVLDVRFGNRRVLLMGDAEQEVDESLLAAGAISAAGPRVDVLKVAHHGSGTASTAALLAAMRPSVAVISVGADNDYGHPARSTLERLTSAGARVFRTDQAGTVDVSTDGTDLLVESSDARWMAHPGASAGALAMGDGRTNAAWTTTGRADAGWPDGRPQGCIESLRDPLARGSRRHPARTRSTRLAAGPRRGRRRDRLVPGRALCRPGHPGGSRARRGGRPPPRHRQAPPV